jgi:3-deoxy-D-manno-octulosonic-acid transferase
MPKYFQLLYRLGISLYHAAVFIASWFNPKAKDWIHGRRNWKQKLNDFVQSHGHPPLWVHASSAGEFEQARTVIDAYRAIYPAHKILLTFFSPSGYNLRKNYKGVDAVMYLPLDTPTNAQTFVTALKPGCAVFVKYDYWYYTLKALQDAHIPTILIAAVFRPGQMFWQWWGKPMQACLACFTRIFCQNQASCNILQAHDYGQAILSGDTRFDRVAEIATAAQNYPLIEGLIKGRQVMVAGSTWPADEKLLAQLYTDDIIPRNKILIIAPHEITPGHIRQVQSQFKDSVLYSQLQADTVTHCLIIDNIGMLAGLYRYANWAYVGGGFGSGIHNILEAAVYGKPVLFGPTFHKFYEAKDLVQQGGAFTLNTYADLQKYMAFLSDTAHYNKSCDIALQYCADNTGATPQIMAWLSQIAALNQR